MKELFGEWLNQLVVGAPLILVLLIGASLAWFWRTKFPFCSKIVLSAGLLHLGIIVLGSFSICLLRLNYRDAAPHEFSKVLSNMDVVLNSGKAVAYGLFFWAAFSDRNAITVAAENSRHPLNDKDPTASNLKLERKTPNGPEAPAPHLRIPQDPLYPKLPSEAVNPQANASVNSGEPRRSLNIR